MTTSRALLSLSLLLAACGGEAKPAADTTATPAEPTPAVAAGVNGAEEYTVCATCHQPDGKGMPGAFPPLAGSELLTGPADKPIAIVLHGLTGPVTVAGTEYNGMMMPWGTLSDEQIAAILTYERSSWGNTASAVTVAEVAAVRKATAARTTPWTITELESAALK